MGPGRPATALLLALACALLVRAEPRPDEFALAVDHYTHGRWALAESHFAQVLAQEPRHAEAASAQFLRAESQLQQKKYAAARDGLLAFLQGYPQHRYARQALFRAGETAFLSQAYAPAGAELSRFRQEYPDDALNAYALNYLGEIALSQGQVVAAQELFREQLRRYPEGPLGGESRWGLGRSLESQGQVDEAREEYRRLVRDGRALADRAQVQLGISYYSRGRYEDAAGEFQQAVTLFADSQLVPQARYWLGVCRLGQERWAEARQILSDAIAQHSGHPLIPAMTHWLAKAHFRDGDSEAASAVYARVWTQWPDSEWADDSLADAIDIALASADHERVQELAARFEARYLDSRLRPRVQQAAGRALLDCGRQGEAIAMLQRSLDPGRATAAEADPTAAVPVRTPDEIALQHAGRYYLALAYLGDDQPAAALASLDQIDPQAAGGGLQLGLQVARATALVAQQQYAQAIPLLEAALADQPQGPEAVQCRLQLIVALAHSGQAARAVELQEQLAAAAPEDSVRWRAAYELAEAAYDAGDYQLAAASFAKLTAAEAPPEYAAKGWSGLGWTHYQLGSPAVAAEHFQRLCTTFPDSSLVVEGAILQAKCLEQSGKSAGAVEVYLGLIARGPGPEHEPVALFEAARLQEALGQRGAALGLLDRLVEQYPRAPRSDAAHYQRAWLLMELERSDEAEEAFQQLSEEFPDSRYWCDATYRLAEHAARDQHWDRAETLVARLLESRQTSPEIRCHALYLQGQLAAAGERWQDVAAPLEQLREQFPGTPLEVPAEYWIAEAHFRQQDYARAAAAFSRLSQRIGPGGESWLGMIPLRQAQILLHQEQWSQAAETAAAIAPRFPGFRQVHEADYVIGRCRARQGKFDQARQAYERVIRSPEGGKTETAAMAQWMLGETYLHQQDYVQAIRAFRQVDELFAYPRWQAAALLQAGKCLELDGQPGEASRTFQRLLDTHPQSPFASEAATRLRRLAQPVSATASYQDPHR